MIRCVAGVANVEVIVDEVVPVGAEHGGNELAGKPQMHAFVAIEPARLSAADADPEMTAGRTERGEK